MSVLSLKTTVMTEMPLSPQKLQVYSWHKWAGVTVFVLLLVRVSWRIAFRPPALPWQMSKLQQVVTSMEETRKQSADPLRELRHWRLLAKLRSLSLVVQASKPPKRPSK